MPHYAHPEVLTLCDGEGQPTHVVLAWDRNTARLLGIREPARSDGTVHTAFRLPQAEPKPASRRRLQGIGQG